MPDLRWIFSLAVCAAIALSACRTRKEDSRPELPDDAKAKLNAIIDRLGTGDSKANRAVEKELAEHLSSSPPTFHQALAYLKTVQKRSAKQAVRTSLEEFVESIREWGITQVLVERIPGIAVRVKYPETITNDFEAIRDLGNLGHPDAIAPLAKYLKNHDPAVRWTAAEALGGYKDRKAAQGLMSALDDDDEAVKAVAAVALGRISDAEAVGKLIAGLGSEEASSRGHAAEILGRVGDRKAVGPLCEACEDESDLTRILAAEALGRIGDPAAVSTLIGLTDDENGLIRNTAAEALGEIGGADAAARLAEMMAGGDGIASLALIHIGAPAARTVEKVLREGGGRARLSAATVLREIGNPDSADALAGLLGEEDMDVLFQAMYALGTLKDERVIPVCEKMLSGEGNAVLQIVSAFCLARIKGFPRAFTLLKSGLVIAGPVPQLRAAIVQMIGDTMGTKAEEILEKVWKEDKFPPSRIKAAQALFVIAKRADAIESLIRDAYFEDASVRYPAQEALREIGRDALPFIRGSMEQKSDEADQSRKRLLLLEMERIAAKKK